MAVEFTKAVLTAVLVINNAYRDSALKKSTRRFNDRSFSIGISELWSKYPISSTGYGSVYTVPVMTKDFGIPSWYYRIGRVFVVIRK